MGLDAPDFAALVHGIVAPHVDHLDIDVLTTRPSRNGKYQSVTVPLIATSRAQLDAIYQALSAHQRVVLAL